jgi:hypothetical protein
MVVRGLVVETVKRVKERFTFQQILSVTNESIESRMAK